MDVGEMVVEVLEVDLGSGCWVMWLWWFFSLGLWMGVRWGVRWRWRWSLNRGSVDALRLMATWDGGEICVLRLLKFVWLRDG